jgi:DNA-binding transcriptional MerR regulator
MIGGVDHHIATGYSSLEVCRLTGVTYRQLDYWTRIGLIRPSFAQAHGSGTQRRWSPTDIARIRRIRLAAQLCSGTLTEALGHLEALEAELHALHEADTPTLALAATK